MDIPQVIAGRFRVECEIGRGGMGTVYRASHLGLERTVAVKVLKKEVSADPEVAERFMREARTMARLRHPRAAMIFDAGRLADGRPFIVMEYVEGSTLADTLAREGTFTPERAVRVAAEICDVLAEAHALGIVHRDLKPSNIMLNERGVCVLDFGIAKVLQTSTEVTRTHPTTESGLIIGTPRYMSPEQCLGNKVGPASDLYSVGVIVYEMLAGRPPFVDVLSSAVLVKQATSAPPPLLALRADVPRPLAIATHTLLAKNPAQRPTEASDARRLLEKSIIAPRREMPEQEIAPFASTISYLDTGRAVFTRVAAACAVLGILGAVFLVWAGSGASRSSAHEKSLSAATSSAASNALAGNALRRGETRAAEQTPPQQTSSMLSPDAARRVAAGISHGNVADARPLRMGEGQTSVAAIHDESADGTTHLFVFARRGDQNFRVTGRAPLDVDGFRGAKWTQEVVDLDGDGSDEVLCTGTNARGDRTHTRRYVLYVPRTRQTYTLRLAPGANAASAVRATWSPNIVNDAAQPFRLALRQRAFTAPRAL
ncbi:MAG: serine/threonine protein kinase [Acidobacteria bacterium]|nr:serine/threonine protein kinase [Acidobacteriota bacterium]